MSRNPNRESRFHFKQFSISDSVSAMKIGTDGVLLGAWAARTESVNRILDIGTGTGLIALMLAQRFENALITALEIDPAAAEEAMENVSLSPWHDRVRVVNADFKQWKTSEQYDLIVSNPPFFTTGLRASDQQRANARHTDTLTCSDILSRTSDLITSSGHLCLITPADISDTILFESALGRLNLVRKCDVKTIEGKIPIRTLWDFSPIDSQPEVSSITIRTKTGYSDEYRNLTAGFYLHF